MYDDKEGIIPGNALVVDPKKQFRPLSKYGNAFLNRFQCSTVASPVLQVRNKNFIYFTLSIFSHIIMISRKCFIITIGYIYCRYAGHFERRETTP